MNKPTCRATDVASRKCANCFFATADQIPDPSVSWEPGMRQKPRIDGFRCHIHAPASAGFPPVCADSFCAFFTDRATLDQPLRNLVIEGGVR